MRKTTNGLTGWLAAGLATVLITSGLATSAVAQNAPAQLTIELENDTIAVSREPVDVSVLIRITGASEPKSEAAGDDERTALNLGLTLDRSGSMAEAGKWDYALEASLGVMDRLRTNDRLSITTYNFDTQNLWMRPSLVASDPYALRHQRRALMQVYPDGGTNISEGLKDNAARLGEIKGEGRLSRVLLMSDGLANEGITDRDRMAGLVKRLTRKGLSISTIGLGAEYDEAMLRAIARAGGGNYYYVESPAQVGRIFDQEVRGLVNTAAEELSLNLVGESGVRTVLINNITRDGDAYELGNLRFGETVTLIGTFTLPAASRVENLNVGTVQLSMKDRATGRLLLLEQPVAVSVSKDPVLIETRFNPEVAAERTLVQVEKVELEAAAKAAAGDYSGAQDLIETSQEVVQSASASWASTLSDKALGGLRSKSEALSVNQERLSAPSATSRSALKSSNQSLFYASKGQRKYSSMKRGDQGFEVENLEKALKDSGYAPGIEDGLFDSELEAAVRKYQADNGLSVDGLAGPATLAELGLF